MHIEISKRNVILFLSLLTMLAAALAYIGVLKFHTEQPAPPAYDDQPALQALAVVYAPSGERAVWEQTACANMTPEGCELFKAYYAPTVWEAQVSGSGTHFIGVVEELEDGSQVWLCMTTMNDSALPLYIHAVQRADERWYLARILFEEEALKYAD